MDIAGQHSDPIALYADNLNTSTARSPVERHLGPD